MAKLVTYPDLYTHRKYSILPSECQEIAYEIGKALNSNSLEKHQIDKFRTNFGNLEPSCVSRALIEIRDIANIRRSYRPQEYPTSFLGRFQNIWKKLTELKVMNVESEAGWIFIFHGDGYLRQSGLSSLNSPPQSPFEFTSIVYRLNDWVENVRNKAITFATLRFPETKSDIISESAFFLLEQSEYLLRWNDHSRRLLQQQLFRPDVLLNLKDKFLKNRTGRLAYVLSHLLRRPEFDIYLEELALHAELPQVRAVAFDALLNERAIWPTGYKKIWIDKVYGVSGRERVTQTRHITHSLDVQNLLSLAASDNSAVVRKVAANSLIALPNKNIPEKDMRDLATCLSRDKSKSVRKIAEFYLNKVDTN